MKKIVIAIDGFSACGKSTTAKIVASHLQYIYIDTGAMYRAVTLYFLLHQVEISKHSLVEEALRRIQIDFVHNPLTGKSEIHLNSRNVEAEIRKMYISERVSEVSALPEVRKEMVRHQQRMGAKRGVVMDGRDIGTVVFPDAELKIFMNADLKIRAYRRKLELLEKGEDIGIDDIIENLKKRDYIDANRKESPLRQAPDAYYLDTTHLTTDEQAEYVLNLAVGKKLVI
jgi:cytidylate kinase